MKEITHGTVQGSMLGPVLFALFIAALEDLVPNLITYADDNYQMSSNKEERGALDKCIIETEKMTTWMWSEL